jgi:hypothetical protein
MERQPILRKLIEQGYVGAPQLKGFQINEKFKTGVAIVETKGNGTSKLYWHESLKCWNENEPVNMVRPSIIERHYASAV